MWEEKRRNPSEDVTNERGGGDLIAHEADGEVSIRTEDRVVGGKML